MATTKPEAPAPRPKVYEIITARIIEALERGVCPWRKPWACTGTSGRLPFNATTSKVYRGVNVFTLAMESMLKGFNDPRWITFNQAKAIGGTVRKGEKGTPVIFWNWVEKEKENQPEEIEKIPFLKYYTVFNVEQCDGLNLPELEKPAPATSFEIIDAAAAILEGMPKRPITRHSGDRACYTPSADVVILPPPEAFESPAHYYATAFHEYAHATGHECRLGRHKREEYAFHSWGDENYSREELVAEFTAAFLAAEAGIAEETLEPSASYIAGWIKHLKKDPKAAVTAAAAAQKAADFILDRKAEEPGEEQATA